MTTDTDLIARLREADENSAQRIAGSRIFKEAADRLEALTTPPADEALDALDAEAAQGFPTMRTVFSGVEDGSFVTPDLGAAVSLITRQRDAITALRSQSAAKDARIAELERLDREAATHVESVIAMRTGFTGDEPYVGWRGLGMALNEALDERDQLRADNERMRDIDGVALHQLANELSWDKKTRPISERIRAALQRKAGE